MAVVQSQWYKEEMICDTIENFYKKKALVPNVQTAKEDLKEKMQQLKIYLEQNYNLCDTIFYTGSAFESLNIAEDVTEFDVMLVRRTSFLKLNQNMGNGFYKIKCSSNMIEYPVDEMGLLNAYDYRQNFKGLVQKWVNIMTKNQKIKLIRIVEHGVATQIDVYNNKGLLWYHLDLVPCFELTIIVDRNNRNNQSQQEKIWCVPKDEGDQYYWRLSYSKDELKQADGLQSNAKKCIRIIKALFKLETDGLFTKFTSYHIKTVAFHLTKSGSWPDDNNLGETVYNFLKFVMESLKQRTLKHFFNPSINILNQKGINYDQLVNTIQNWLRSKNSFSSLFSC